MSKTATRLNIARILGELRIPEDVPDDNYCFFLTWEEAQKIIDVFDAEKGEISTKLSEQLLVWAITVPPETEEDK